MYSPDWRNDIAVKKPETPMRGLGEILKENGYQTEYYHNGPLAYANKIAFYTNLGYDKIYGLENLDEQKKFERFGWGFGDEHLWDIIAKRLNKQTPTDSPIHLAIFTISTHHPFYPVYPKKGLYTPQKNNQDWTQVPTETRYENCLHYADASLQNLFSGLTPEALNNTIFIITGDHSIPTGNRNGETSIYTIMYEDNIKTPFFIYAPGLTHTHLEIDDIGSSIDITPTILDMLEISCENHMLGKSLLQKPTAKNNFAYFDNTYNFVGVRQGDYKYLWDRNKKEGFLFNLKTDPKELESIEADNPAIAATLKEKAINIWEIKEKLWNTEKIWYQ
jgi:phosphoglycerol transferase MdoB-like AlkP superfamily enzyme